MFDDLNSLYRLTKSDIDKASEIMAKAYFEADDFSRFSTDPARRMKNTITTMAMTLRYSLKFGVVYAPSQNLEGVVAWLPHNKVKISIWQYIRLGMLPVVLSVGKAERNDILVFDRIMKRKHREHANFPHLYLYNLAVAPEHQGKGWTSVLLKPMLAKADRERLPCYLESPERNLSLYKHFGFEVLEHITLGDSENEGYIMMRYNK